MDRKKFYPTLIDRYTVPELYAFVLRGDVSLEFLYDHGLEISKYNALKNLIESHEWLSIREYPNENHIIHFLNKYPESRYRTEARELLNSILKEKRNEGMVLRQIVSRNLYRDLANYIPTSPRETQSKNTYLPQQQKQKKNFWKTIWKKISSNKSKRVLCNSAVFAPAEIAKGDDMFVQVYIYKDEESEQVILDAKMSDENASQRCYTPLNFRIKTGDNITVKLDMHGLVIEGDSKQTFVWNNRFAKCGFFLNIPLDYSKNKVMGDVYVSVNGLEIGRLSFFSKLAGRTDNCVSAEVLPHTYKKVFISYSHKDDKTVKPIAEAYRALGVVEYFYDRHSLSPGEIYEKRIFDFIDDSDLFLLCWSKNAAQSEWVKKERVRAYKAAIVEPPKIRLYPINIYPYSQPPSEMTGKLHFEDYDKLIAQNV